jgi:hypothetical protein
MDVIHLVAGDTLNRIVLRAVDRTTKTAIDLSPYASFSLKLHGPVSGTRAMAQYDGSLATGRVVYRPSATDFPNPMTVYGQLEIRDSAGNIIGTSYPPVAIHVAAKY